MPLHMRGSYDDEEEEKWDKIRFERIDKEVEEMKKRRQPMPKILSDKKLKLAVSEVLLYKDRLVSVSGKRNSRDNITLAKYPLFASIVAAFTPTMEVGYIRKTLISKPKDDEILWARAGEGIPVKDPAEIDAYKPFTERHTDDIVHFDDEQVELIKECLMDRKDLGTFVEYKQLKEWLYDTVKEGDVAADDKDVVDASGNK